jgi:hypothetical protein
MGKALSSTSNTQGHGSVASTRLGGRYEIGAGGMTCRARARSRGCKSSALQAIGTVGRRQGRHRAVEIRSQIPAFRQVRW